MRIHEEQMEMFARVYCTASLKAVVSNLFDLKVQHNIQIPPFMYTKIFQYFCCNQDKAACF